MQRITSIIKSLSLGLAILLFLAAAGFGADCVRFSDPTFKDPTRQPACFDHENHADFYDCATCHHVYDDDGNPVKGESSEGMYCSDCHYDSNDPKQMDLMSRYHKQCKECHIQEKSGPITCAGCHKKEK